MTALKRLDGARTESADACGATLMASAIDSASPVGGTSFARDMAASADFRLSARAGVIVSSITLASESVPSLCAVREITAPRFSAPLAQRNPRESQGCQPVTTLRGSVFGAVKWDLNPSTNIPWNARGNLTAESCAATDIVTRVAIESLAWSVSRQPRLAEPERDAEPAGRRERLLEQATMMESAARINANERRRIRST